MFGPTAVANLQVNLSQDPVGADAVRVFLESILEFDNGAGQIAFGVQGLGALDEFGFLHAVHRYMGRYRKAPDQSNDERNEDEPLAHVGPSNRTE